MKLSVIIPVYNEQSGINEKIDHLRSLGDFEIIVSDANGFTNKVISHKDVILITSSRGRGLQMNDGAAHASGDVLLFLHADTELPDNFIKEIENALKNHSAGAFAFAIASNRKIYRIIEKVTNFRNKMTKTPYGDQALFCTREAFDKIGGYRDFPIMEDVQLMRDFKKHNIKIYLSDSAVKTSARRWEKEGILYTTLRNWFIILLYYIGVSSKSLKSLYK